MFRSIRSRIAIPYVLLILITLLGLGLYLSNFVRQFHMNQLSEKQTNEALLVSDAFSLLFEQNAGVQTLDDETKHLASKLNARLTIVDADGVVVGESHGDRLTMENHGDRLEIQEAITGRVGHSIRYSRTTGYDTMYTAAPILTGEQIVGVARLAIPLQEIERNVNHLRWTIMGATLLATVMAVLLAVIIAEQTTLPLRDLSQAAHNLAEGKTDQIIKPLTNDEVGQLATAFRSKTRQLQAQMDALSMERVKLDSVLQHMTDAVLLVDSQGRIQLFNSAAERIFNVPVEAALGRSLAEALRHYQIVDLWRICLKTGETQESPIEYGPKRLSILGQATSLAHALPGNTMLIFQDQTRIRQLEIVRQEFISNISHELRTPLASLKALTETLQESALDDPPAARHFLSRMDTELDALTQMVAELLELSRIESGKLLLHFKSTPPHEIVKPVAERMKLQAERAGLVLETDCPEDLPQILADTPRLQQVLVNLLHNAIKYTPSGGRIQISVKKENQSVLFRIEDNGVGIREEDVPRIFERFYKADRARSGGGAGLGLAIARHLIEAHGGRIWAESREGQGSIFFFLLPSFED
jgi:two-component system, OmpR family, phosphate regulon sensor histidine kinase PhoR